MTVECDDERIKSEVEIKPDFKKKSKIGRFFARILTSSESGMLIPIIILIVIIGSINPVFFAFENLMNVAKTTSFTFIVAIGMTLLLIAGSFDLSVGSFLALGSLIVGMCMQSGVPISLSIIAAVAAGVLGGLLNGFIVVTFNVPPLITTLGTLYMARGVVLILTRGAPIYPLPEKFNVIGNGALIGIPYVAIIAIVLAVLAHFVLNRTTFGRAIYAVGGNENTARLSGIKVKKHKVAVFTITCVLATFTGVLVASRLGSSQPNIGDGFELQVIASAIIGGTSLFGGAGTILGTALGALFMNILSNGMTLIRVSAYWQKFVIGFVIILAVAIDQYKRSRKVY